MVPAPGLSFRGAKRRGNLLQPVTFSPRPTCYPTWSCEIATGAKRPRNDKFGSRFGRRGYLAICNCPWRSLSAATDAIGAYYFIGTLYQLPVQRREGHAPPLQCTAGGPRIIHSSFFSLQYSFTSVPRPYNTQLALQNFPLSIIHVPPHTLFHNRKNYKSYGGETYVLCPQGSGGSLVGRRE